MVVTKRLFENYNYFYNLKKTTGVVSNKFKDVITLGKYALNKEMMTVEDFGKMKDMVITNPSAYLYEHTEDLTRSVNEADKVYNDGLIEKMRNEEYAPSVYGKVA